MKITITRALVELKTLGSRIDKSISNLNLITIVTGQNPPLGFANRNEFNIKAISDYNRIIDLIKYQQSIKSAIVAANASTFVTIADEK